MNFPPKPSHPRQIETALEVLASAINGRTAVYVSAPITSGRRFSDWYAARKQDLDTSLPEYEEELHHEVVEPNRAHARTYVRHLRSKLNRTLIDPTAVSHVPGWTQCDYRYLWASVLERYVDTILFMDGWHYSSGCAYEFLVAHRSGATTFQQDERPLTLRDGTSLIRSAIEEMRDRELPTSFLERVVEELDEILNTPSMDRCAT